MLTRVSPDPGVALEDRWVFVLELTGVPDAIGLDRAFDAIVRYGREPGARVVVDVAGVRRRSAIESMLAAARDAVGSPFTVLGDR